jgi:hypothetical protein
MDAAYVALDTGKTPGILSDELQGLSDLAQG